MSNLKIYLTNLSQYTNGYLIGKHVQLPINENDLKEVLKEIGIDGIQYEEYFISDIETDIIGMGEIIEEYTSIKDLNELAEMLDNYESHYPNFDSFRKKVERLEETYLQQIKEIFIKDENSFKIIADNGEETVVTI